MCIRGVVVDEKAEDATPPRRRTVIIRLRYTCVRARKRVRVCTGRCVRSRAAGPRTPSPVGGHLPPMGGRPHHGRQRDAAAAAVNNRLTNRLVNYRLHTGAYGSPLAVAVHCSIV